MIWQLSLLNFNWKPKRIIKIETSIDNMKNRMEQIAINLEKLEAKKCSMQPFQTIVVTK